MTRLVWQRQYSDLHEALRPYVLRAGDGFLYVSHDAPARLVQWYGDLRTVGYANGWLR